jgi:hypothetical protein
VTHFDSSGHQGWTRIFGSTADDNATAAAMDGHHGVYVAGTTSGSFDGQTNPGNASPFLAHFNAVGDLAWTRIFGSRGVDTADSLARDGGNAVYIAGWTNGSFAGQANHGGRSPFVARYGTDGHRIWTRIFGTSRNDAAYALAADGRGGVYVAGETRGSFGGQTNPGYLAAFTVHYTGTGVSDWTRIFGGTDSTTAWAAVADAGSGSVYVAGRTFDSFGGQTNPGSVSAFLTKWSPIPR